MAGTSIEWTQVTWNPVTGCDRISPGCDNCYALALAGRLKAMGQPKYQHDGDPRTSGPGFVVTVHPNALHIPGSWREPRLVFVDSMSDLSLGLVILNPVFSLVRQHKYGQARVRHVSGTCAWSFCPCLGYCKAMRPLRFPGPAWFVVVAEVEQGSAPVEHECLAIGPRRDCPAIGVEKRTEQARVSGMVHADDPLAPGEVVDRVSGVGPFPVQDPGDLQGYGVEKDILGAVVPVHEHLPATCGAREGRGHLAGIKLVDPLEHGAAGAQHAAAVAGFKQFLSVDAGHERHGQAPVAEVQDLRHRDPGLQGAQHGVLNPEPGQRAGSLIALHDGRAVPERAIGVAVPQRLHALILAAGAGDHARRAWSCAGRLAGRLRAGKKCRDPGSNPGGHLGGTGRAGIERRGDAGAQPGGEPLMFGDLRTLDVPRQAGRARSRAARTSSGQSRSATWIGPTSLRAGRRSSWSGQNEPVRMVT